MLIAEFFIPHGHCYLWKPGLVWLHITSDALTALAYYSIPLLIIYFIQKKENLPFNWIFQLFSAFILACGTTHLMEIWTLWHPTYWTSGIIKAGTAIISCYTAVMLLFLIPKALALPSPEQLQEANTALQKETKERQIKTTQLEQTLQVLQETKSQLIQIEKLASVGKLVAGIAHHINNPASFIYGNIIHAREYTSDLLKLVNLYKQYYQSPEPEISKFAEEVSLDFLIEDYPKLLKSMETGADRIIKVVQSLRNFNPNDKSKKRSVDINEILDSVLQITENSLKSTSNPLEIKFTKEYRKIPKINCYPEELHLAFMNIIDNSIYAVSESNHKQIRSENKSFLGRIQVSTVMINSDKLVINIQDNGIGISPTIQLKIFDPFFTTKSAEKGNGLGLYISYQIIVERHHGQLYCRSSPGQGTKLVIELPVYSDSESLNPAKNSQILPPSSDT